eukprot:5835042-Prymnesium_polylepis.1
MGAVGNSPQSTNPDSRTQTTRTLNPSWYLHGQRDGGGKHLGGRFRQCRCGRWSRARSAPG